MRPRETVMMGMERGRVEICQTSHRFIDSRITCGGRVRPLTGIDPIDRRLTHSASPVPSLLAVSSSTAFRAAAFFAADFLAAVFLAGAVVRGGSLAGDTAPAAHRDLRRR